MQSNESALLAQFQRAERDQRAPSGFAKKAYAAQEAYLAEQSLDFRGAARPTQNESTLNESAMRDRQSAVSPVSQPAGSGQLTVSKPITLVARMAPPVHISPANVSARPNAGASSEPTVKVASTGYPYPGPVARGGTGSQEFRRQSNRAASPGGMGGGMVSATPSATRQGVPAPAGIQDRIKGFLSGPRTRNSIQSPRRGGPNEQAMVQSAPAPARVVPAPQQPARNRQYNVTRSNDRKTRAPERGRRQRMPVHRRGNPVRQVMMTESTMVEPVQDPFNDLPARATQTQPAVRPSMQSPRSTSYQDVPPMKQISVLSNSTRRNPNLPGERRQPASLLQQDDNQFGSPVAPAKTEPVQDNSDVLPPPSFPSSDNSQPSLQESVTPPPAADPSRAEPLTRGDSVPSRSPDFQADEQEPEGAQTDDTMNKLERLLDDRFRELDGDSSEEGLRFETRETTCDEFRSELLGGSIKDIALDISPPSSRHRLQRTAESRSWTDLSGNVVAEGAILDLRRGYVIIEGEQGIQKIPYAKLSDADWHAISDFWHLPELCIIRDDNGPSRSWVPQTYTWKASGLCHKPLYFEDVQLERYGHSRGPFRQPVYSAAHFFVSLVTVPYQSGIHPATECQYALGYYRPGDCAPWLRDPIPLSLSGALRQAIVTTGIAVIP